MSLGTIIKKSLTPLMVANLVAMVGSGVWLIAKGYIYSVWPTALALLLSPFLFPLLLLPAAMCAGIMQLFSQAKPALARAMGFLSATYLVWIFSFYAMLSIYMMEGALVTDRAAGAIYAVSAAIAPWAVLAAKDRENLFFIGLIWMTEITAIAVLYAILTVKLTFAVCLLGFFGIMAGLVLVQALYERMFLKKETPPSTPS